MDVGGAVGKGGLGAVMLMAGGILPKGVRLAIGGMGEGIWGIEKGIVNAAIVYHEITRIR